MGSAEQQVPAGQAAHLGREVEQVPARVGDHVLLGHRQQGRHLGQVAEHSFRPQLVHHRVDERLLAVGTVQVAVEQPLTLPDERQRLRGVQVLVPPVEVRAGLGVADRVVEADFHAAEDLRELIEPVQVDLGEVVDADPGELLDRGHGSPAPGLVAEERELVLAHAGVLLPQLRLLEVHAHAVSLVHLAHLLRPDRAGEMHPVVARDREADRLLSASEYVDED